MTATKPAPSAAGAPTRLSLPGSRRRLGRVSVPQIVAVQLAAVGALAAYPTPDAVFLPVLAVALAVVGAMFARRGGRWWHEELRQRFRFWRRTRQARRGAPGDRWTALSPSVSFHDMTDRGTRIGIGVDPAGWYAAVAVTAPEAEESLADPHGPPTPDPEQVPEQAGMPAEPPEVPAPPPAGLDRLVQMLTEVAVPASALQLVHHAVPVPTVAASAGEWTWVAMRVHERDAPAEAASRGGGMDGVHRTVAAALGRVMTTLRAGRVEGRALLGNELAEVLAAVGGWSAEDPAVGRAAPERWEAWQGTDAAHLCFRISGSFVLDELVEAVRATSALSATVSVRFEPAHEAADLAAPTPARYGLLRIAAGFDLVDTTLAEVAAAAAQVGCTVQRLDGEHAPAIYATAPTGAVLAGATT